MYVNERIPEGIYLDITCREETEGREKSGKRKMRVIKQYAHHVLMEDEYGIRTCITHAELMQNGIVTQRCVDDV